MTVLHCPPLDWPEDWKRPKRLDTLLLGIPFIGPQHRTRQSICEQLRARDPGCLSLWEESVERFRIARTVSAIVKDELNWPNDLFIPADPCEILFWDFTAYWVDDLKLLAVIQQLEDALHFHLKDETWESVFSYRFGELVDFLLERQNQNEAL